MRFHEPTEAPNGSAEAAPTEAYRGTTRLGHGAHDSVLLREMHERAKIVEVSVTAWRGFARPRLVRAGRHEAVCSALVKGLRRGGSDPRDVRPLDSPRPATRTLRVPPLRLSALELRVPRPAPDGLWRAPVMRRREVTKTLRRPTTALSVAAARAAVGYRRLPPPVVCAPGSLGYGPFFFFLSAAVSSGNSGGSVRRRVRAVRDLAVRRRPANYLCVDARHRAIR